jgi:hypothetical protein
MKFRAYRVQEGQIGLFLSSKSSYKVTMASPKDMFNLIANSWGLMSGFSRMIVSRMYALRLGYITEACTVSTSMTQSFSFVYSSRFIWHQQIVLRVAYYSAYRKGAPTPDDCYQFLDRRKFNSSG